MHRALISGRLGPKTHGGCEPALFFGGFRNHCEVTHPVLGPGGHREPDSRKARKGQLWVHLRALGVKSPQFLVIFATRAI